MNYTISPAMMKWKDEIQKYFGSAMFFVYDNQLINLYEQLSRMTSDELQSFCRDPKFGEMCGIVQDERSGKNIEGNIIVQPFVNNKGMINVEGLLPLLSSFPSFESAMDFIMAVKPGFRYTPQFQKFVESRITKRQISKDTVLYTLGIYGYEIMSNVNVYRIRYLKNGKRHRINGPAEITLETEYNQQELRCAWYREGKLYGTDTQPNYIVYSEDRDISYLKYDYINTESSEVTVIFDCIYTWNDEINTREESYYNGEMVLINESKRIKNLTSTVTYMKNGSDFVIFNKIIHNTKKDTTEIWDYDTDGNTIRHELFKMNLNRSQVTYYNSDGSIRKEETVT